MPSFKLTTSEVREYGNARVRNDAVARWLRRRRRGGPGSDGYMTSLASGRELPPPGEGLHRHFNDHVRGLAGMLYGRRMYEIMRYWDEDRPEFDATERDFAAVWQARPKWVVSRSLKSVGPNATLVNGDLGAFVRRLKADIEGEIDVAGPDLAASLTDLGLVD